MISVDGLAIIVDEMKDDQESDEKDRGEKVPFQEEEGNDAEDQDVAYISEDAFQSHKSYEIHLANI